MTDCIRGSHIYRADSGSDLLYPINIKIRNAFGGYSDVSCLIDTGNEKSIMKREVADLLGLDLNRQGEPFNVKGINGNSIQFKKFHLPVKIGNLEAVVISIGFAMRSGDLAENLLGNEDLLKSGKFEAVFDGKGVTIKTKGTNPKIACGGNTESQETMNDLYDQLISAEERKKSYFGTNSIAGYSVYF